MVVQSVKTMHGAEDSNSAREIQQNDSPSMSECRILIVEDDGDIANLIADAFLNISVRDVYENHHLKEYELPEIASYQDQQIQFARNVDDAVSMIKEAAPSKNLDLVVLDLHIPENSRSKETKTESVHGYDVLEQIRIGELRKQLGYHLPVVVLSANVDIEGETSFGFDYFINLLKERKHTLLPDEFLLKGATGGNRDFLDSDHLLLKTAKYLIDLTEDEERRLRDADINFDKRSVTRRILRELKRIALSTEKGRPLPDVLLLGPNGVGKSTFARAYDILRRTPDGARIAFSSQDLGGLDLAGSAPSLRLFGGTDFASGQQPSDWTLGAFSQATCYRIDNSTLSKRVAYKSQEFSICDQSNCSILPVDASTYPDESKCIDYEASGTLFLDEVVNVNKEMRAMLLQALGYDRRRRHVFTTGRVSRKVPIGPAIVMATRRDIVEMARECEEDDLALRDYLFRIDQVRVTIPPLKERKDEIIPYLQAAIAKRRGKKPDEFKIDVDQRVQWVLMHQLDYHNNFADLERIADQVRPEETIITFGHVRALYEREALAEVREAIRSDYSTIDGCLEHWKRIDKKEQSPISWDNLDDLFELGSTRLLTMCSSLFAHLPNMIDHGDKKIAHWPDADAIGKYFTKEKHHRSFETFVTRKIENIRKKGITLPDDSLKAIYEWIDRTGYFRERASSKEREPAASTRKKSPKARKDEGRVLDI